MRAASGDAGELGDQALGEQAGGEVVELSDVAHRVLAGAGL